MHYIDPSKVEMALRFADVARRPGDARVLMTEELRVFLAALWADATPLARTRYTEAVARQSGELPWSAASLAAQALEDSPKEPVLYGPPLVELIVGQVDPDDEGVPGYRLLVPGDARAEAIVRGFYRWDADLLARVGSPSGWRLESAEDLGDTEETGAEDMQETDPENDGESTSEAGHDSGATGSEGRKAWAAAGVALGFVGLGYAAWRLG